MRSCHFLQCFFQIMCFPNHTAFICFGEFNEEHIFLVIPFRLDRSCIKRSRCCKEESSLWHKVSQQSAALFYELNHTQQQFAININSSATCGRVNCCDTSN